MVRDFVAASDLWCENHKVVGKEESNGFD